MSRPVTRQFDAKQKRAYISVKHKEVEMHPKPILYTLILFALVMNFGCENSPSNMNAKASPTPTEEQKKEITDRIEGEKLKAVGDYVSKNQKGWILSGISGGSEDSKCIADVPCYLHLIQKNQNKVVPVVLRQFQKTDGTTYWFVYAATPVDIEQARVSLIKDKEHKETLSSLTTDECQPVIDEIADARAEDGRGDYDNGY